MIRFKKNKTKKDIKHFTKFIEELNKLEPDEFIGMAVVNGIDITDKPDADVIYEQLLDKWIEATPKRRKNMLYVMKGE